MGNNPNQEYYLRFLPTTDYNGFTSDALQKAKYMGYDASMNDQVFFKDGTKSKFTVTKEKIGIRVFSKDSILKKERIFAWNLTWGATNNGYYMYPKEDTTNYTKVQIEKYTLLIYGDTKNDLSAAQSDPKKPSPWS